MEQKWKAASKKVVKSWLAGDGKKGRLGSYSLCWAQCAQWRRGVKGRNQPRRCSHAGLHEAGVHIGLVGVGWWQCGFHPEPFLTRLWFHSVGQTLLHLPWMSLEEGNCLARIHHFWLELGSFPGSRDFSVWDAHWEILEHSLSISSFFCLSVYMNIDKSSFPLLWDQEKLLRGKYKLRKTSALNFEVGIYCFVCLVSLLTFFWYSLSLGKYPFFYIMCFWWDCHSWYSPPLSHRCGHVTRVWPIIVSHPLAHSDWTCVGMRVKQDQSESFSGIFWICWDDG